MNTQSRILRIAVPVPLRRLFDYSLPENWDRPLPEPGVRVRIPFGRKLLIGIVVEIFLDHPDRELKLIEEVLDKKPLFDSYLLRLLLWSSSYYCHPVGEVMASALPPRLRQGKLAKRLTPEMWRAVIDGELLPTLSRAPRQKAVYDFLKHSGNGCSSKQLNDAFIQWRPIIRQLQRKGLVETFAHAPVSSMTVIQQPDFELNDAQKRAINKVVFSSAQYRAFLLYGVTGSGKTEIYLQLAQYILQQGKQVLILVPEIGLTPQLAGSFRDRFGMPVALLHSGLNDTERLDAWLAASKGEAGIIIGTRSAVYVPLRRPGLVILDEEHDSSFKQMEGFRYSARDVAIMRASQLNIPVLLGSATPSLESFRNVEEEKMTLLHLPERAGVAAHPDIHLVDLRGKKLQHGLLPMVLDTIRDDVDRGGQVLIFLNRRGFSPALICASCGWVSLCKRCDVRMTVHKGAGKLRCHVCSAEIRLPHECPQCSSPQLHHLGYGTERLQDYLEKHFGHYGVLRVDRDTTRTKHAFEQMVRKVRSGEKRILIGTQMLAKGHHFPDVGLVVIVDADAGLYGLDFRAQERMGQLLIQVAGRAGRANRAGRVFVQTYHPDHPFFDQISRYPYEQFAKNLLRERAVTAMPPTSFVVLLRAEAGEISNVEAFLQDADKLAEDVYGNTIMRLGPAFAPLERKAGRYQMQLIIRAFSRSELQKFLGVWVERVEGLKNARKVRWSIDVDPYDLY